MGNGARAGTVRREVEPRPGTASRRRREQLVVRRIDPWTVLKISVVFYVALAAVALVAGVILWLGTTVTGVRSNVEKFIGDLVVAQDFRLVGGKMLQLFAVASASVVVLGTMANLVMVTLYNLISDLIGGFTVVVEGRGPIAPEDPRD